MDGIHDQDEVIDLTGAARPDQTPVPGAQWDELHGRWERWDEAVGSWVIVGGDDGGRLVLPPDESVVPAFFARELHHLDELEAEAEESHIIDVDRLAAPQRPVPGAQWNEVVGRWERWDEAASAWVEARAQAPADRSSS
jgi:hypothetical protein